jgi:hypothetical protein
MASTYLARLRDLRRSSDSLLAHATKGNWEALQGESISHDRIFGELSSLSANGLTYEERGEAKSLTKSIEEAHRQISELVQPRLSELKQLLTEMSVRPIP